MNQPIVALLLTCFLAVGSYWRMAIHFEKSYVVQINGYRISPWVSSAVFHFWVIGMAVGIYVLSLIPRIYHIIRLGT
jgi:hypothetical protein